MILCRLEDVSRHYSSETVFRDVSVQIRAGERIGLVGPNGAGKTTLLRVIAGEDPPDSGCVHWHDGISVVHLRQIRDVTPGRTLLEEVRSAMSRLEGWYEEMVEAGRRMAEAVDPDEHRRAANVYDDRQELLRRCGGYDFRHRIEEVLFGLGFSEEDFDRDVATFSGGQQSRISLARLLLQSPDVMLLDEPTNHLDVAATEWLESYLCAQRAAMVLASHDRYFLDKTSTAIWELAGGRLAVYPGNFSQYWALRAERRKAAERVADRQAEEVGRLQEFVRRNKAGQLAKQAKSREKRIERILAQRVDRIRDFDRPPMAFPSGPRAGDVVLSATGVSKAFDRLLFSDVNLEIERGWRVGVVGPNGSGKTTLLRILLGEEPPTSGRVRMGANVRVGYLRQNVEDLDPDSTCLEVVRPSWRAAEHEEVFRRILARFGVGEDLAENRVGSLSGGQRSRVALARISAQEVNLLVLDEPTNHLDVWACAALEEAIQAFDGAVVVVSHDRYFLNAVCRKLFVVENQRVRRIDGNYDRYVELRSAAAAAAEVRKPKAAPATIPARRKRKYPYRKAEEIEAEIHEREGRLAALKSSLQRPEVYSDGRRLSEVTREIQLLQMEVDQLMDHWTEAMELNA